LALRKSFSGNNLIFQTVEDGLKGDERIERVIVFRRANNEIHIQEGRDVWILSGYWEPQGNQLIRRPGCGITR